MSEELRPPDSQAYSQYYWLRDRNNYRWIAHFDAGVWFSLGGHTSAKTSYERGDTIIAPARPDDATERARMEGEVARLREALQKCWARLQGTAQVTVPDDWEQPVLNDDMRLVIEIEEALRHDR